MNGLSKKDRHYSLPRVSRRWTASDKAQIVALVMNGKITIDEAVQKYSSSTEEISHWIRAFQSSDMEGLKVTKRSRKTRKGLRVARLDVKSKQDLPVPGYALGPNGRLRILKSIENGVISVDDACHRYKITSDNLEDWKTRYESGGLEALRIRSSEPRIRKR